jgi:hypothetical protein
VRLDVVERHALGVEEALQRADLVDDAVGQFLAADLHLAAAEALQVGQRRMRADLDAMRLASATVVRMWLKSEAWKPQATLAIVDQRHQASSSPIL